MDIIFTLPDFIWIGIFGMIIGVVLFVIGMIFGSAMTKIDDATATEIVAETALAIAHNQPTQEISVPEPKVAFDLWKRKLTVF